MKNRTVLDRQKSINKAFFPPKHRSLLKAPKSKPSNAETKRSLKKISGIEDDHLLVRLVELKIDSNTLSTLTLIPLIEVAWADGQLDAEERGLVLAAAKRCKFNRDSYALLKYWLEHPPEELLKVWSDYVAALFEKMDDDERSSFSENLFDCAKRVAEATGGVLGIGKICKLERDVLDEVQKVLV